MSYSKMKLQFVCKMAMLLAFVFVACSDDVAGGVTEETRVQASLDNVTIAGKAGNTVLRVVKSSFEDSTTVFQNYDVRVATKKGSVVTAFELDSVTFDTTGRYFVDTVYNDSGSFSFKNLSLNSPYVLIRVQDSCFRSANLPLDGEKTNFEICRTWTAVADVRKSEGIGINLLTHIKSFNLLELVRSGVPFDVANKQAEQNVLESYGVYDDLENFESLESGNRSELSYVNQLAAEYPLEFMAVDTMTSYWYLINNMGGEEFFREFEESEQNSMSKVGFVNWILRLYPELILEKRNLELNMSDLVYVIDNYKSVPLKAVSSSQEEKRLYEEILKLLDYKVNYIAKKTGLERCTEQREGNMEKNEYLDVVCRSGKWRYGYKRIEHTNGTMVDDRDGKTYKTVTYNVGGKQQTWMAENLNFSEVSLSTGCYAGGESSCDVNGRMYEWRSAMNFDETKLKVFFVDSTDTLFLDEKCKHRYDGYGQCLLDKTKECGRTYSKVWNECNDLYGGRSWIGLWDWNYTEMMASADPSDYQGVCPDGWRLPTAKDWDALTRFVEEQYGTDSVDVRSALFDEDATGFGVKEIVEVNNVSGKLEIRVLSHPVFLAIPDFDAMPHTFTFGSLIFGRHGPVTLLFEGDREYLSLKNAPYYNYDFAYEPYWVRCIKN